MLHLSVLITVYATVLALILGACFGSFLNCMAWRIVHGESVLKGRSHCDNCGHVLGFGDLVPIASYLAHGGKCRYCGQKISKGQLWGEIISALVFALLLWRYDISLQLLEYLGLACVLLACSFADLEGYIIPDRFILAGIGIRLIFILTSGDIINELLFSALGGIPLVLVMLLIVFVMEKILKREAMGGGDIKLLFLTGIFLGWQLNIMCLIFACLFGIVCGIASAGGKKHGEGEKLIPWGPSIAAGAGAALIFGEPLLSWYLSLF